MYATKNHVVFTLLLLLAGALLLAGCDQDTRSGDFEYLPLYGDGTHDTSRPIAKVGEVTITERDMELRLKEMPASVASNFAGPEGKRLLLDKMITESLLVFGSVDEEMYRDQDVAQTLISMRRESLASGMRNYGILRGNEPDDEQMREYYDNHREDYVTLVTMRARHIECNDRETADFAYARLQKPGRENMFPFVCGELSINKQTRENGGETGWFNPGHFVKDIFNGLKFTETVGDLEVGLHPPVQIGDRWHVVEVLEKKPSRHMTFQEARSRIKTDMLPGYQDALTKNWLRDARGRYGVELLGPYAPGQGLTPEQLFDTAMTNAEPDKSIEYMRIIYLDYPESDLADNALFMCGTLALKAWNDRNVGGRYLRILLEEYPESELADDAQLILDNLYNPAFWEPQSIEDLKKIHSRD